MSMSFICIMKYQNKHKVYTLKIFPRLHCILISYWEQTLWN